MHERQHLSLRRLSEHWWPRSRAFGKIRRSRRENFQLTRANDNEQAIAAAAEI